MPLIPPRINALYQEKIEALIEDLGKRYIVTVETTSLALCPNCVYDRFGKCSSGQARPNAATPFDRICPVCRNKGKIPTTTQSGISAIVKLAEARTGDKPEVEGDLPEGHARLKTYYKYQTMLAQATAFYIDGVRYNRLGQPKAGGLLNKVVTYVTLQRSD